MIKIVIADDHKLFAKGLAGILNNSEQISVAAIFNDGRSLIDYLLNQNADIALIDLNMPYFDGYQTLKGIKNHHIATKNIILTMYADDSILKKCKEIGFDAYLLKDTEPEELIRVICEVYEGNYLPQDQASKGIGMNTFNDNFVNKHKLSKRELEIAGLIANGLTNQEIGKTLFISTFTVDTHRKNIISKLGVKTPQSWLNWLLKTA